MRWTTFLAILLTVILSSGVCVSQARAEPTLGGGFAVVYDIRGEVLRPAVTWSLKLTKAPSVPLIADGLLLSDGTYGLGVTTPLPTLTTPLFKAMGVEPSDGFTDVLNAVQVGGAVLTQNLNDWNGGFYAKVTAFTF